MDRRDSGRYSLRQLPNHPYRRNPESPLSQVGQYHQRQDGEQQNEQHQREAREERNLSPIQEEQSQESFHFEFEDEGISFDYNDSPSPNFPSPSSLDYFRSQNTERDHPETPPSVLESINRLSITNDRIPAVRLQFDNRTRRTMSQPESPPRQPPPNVPVPPPIVVQQIQQSSKKWLIDPYDGDINPGSPQGQKLFLAATQPADDADKLELCQENARKIKDRFYELSKKFKWGPMITHIMNEQGKYVNMFHNNNDLSILDMKKQASHYMSDGSEAKRNAMEAVTLDPANLTADQVKFYKRVRSTMIGKAILGNITSQSVTHIFNDRDMIEWKHPITGEIFYDGPTILKRIFDHINPSTKIGVGRLKLQLSTAKLSKYDNNVQTMLTTMKAIYKDITENHGKTHDDYIIHLFNALLSTTNPTYRNCIQGIKDSWEMGIGDHKDIEPDELIQLGLTKYSNMSEDKIWDEIDPKDAQILALTTKLETTDAKYDKLMQCYQTNSSNSLKTVSNSKSQKFDQSRGVYDGPTKTFDGVLMHWCDKGHKSPRSPNGLYMPHKPEDHDKWEAERAAKRTQFNNKRSSGGYKASTSSSGSDEKNKLTLSQSLDPKDLKAALATNFGINEEDASSFAEKFLEEVVKK